MKIALKLDIDTLRGYTEGLPRLLSKFKEYDVRASIFFSMGPDNSGRAIRRIFRRGFISKMLRTKAPSTYGIKTLLYGTLLPAPMIVKSNPDLLIRAIDEGHDCGVHAWDHVFWQDEVPKLSRERIREEFSKSFSLFESISGARPTCVAAPGWQVTEGSLEVQDELSLDYASDMRGASPFYPIGHRTLQVPSTLPTMDEILGTDGVDDATVAGALLGAMKGREFEVATIHTEMEGGAKLGQFDEFLRMATDAGAEFITLREVASAARNGRVPTCEVERRGIFGRAGTLAFQGKIFTEN